MQIAVRTPGKSVEMTEKGFLLVEKAREILLQIDEFCDIARGARYE